MTLTKIFRNRECFIAGQMGREVNAGDIFPESVGRSNLIAIELMRTLFFEV